MQKGLPHLQAINIMPPASLSFVVECARFLWIFEIQRRVAHTGLGHRWETIQNAVIVFLGFTEVSWHVVWTAVIVGKICLGGVQASPGKDQRNQFILAQGISGVAIISQAFLIG